MQTLIPENLVVVHQLWEIHHYKLIEGPIIVECLKCCDWSIDKLIKVEFLKVNEQQSNFQELFFSASIITYLCKTLPQIIECQILGPYGLSRTLSTLWSNGLIYHHEENHLRSTVS